MGAFYWNIVLKGPKQQDIARVMTDLRVEAWISPTIDDITAVYDAISDGYTGIVLGNLASQLSTRFCCTALTAGVWDDSVFYYRLYRDGVLIDVYESDHPESDGCSPPKGGDAKSLCAAFDKEQAEDDVSAILRYWWCESEANGESRMYADEMERHLDLIRVLGLPKYAGAWSHRYIAQDIADNSFDESGFLMVSV